MALPLAILLLLSATDEGQSVDQILRAAAQREAMRACAPATEGEVIVCGDRNAADRYRLPLPVERSAAEAGAVVGEVPAPTTQDPFLSGCGIFRGQRRCGKAEAHAYGYGAGRDPVTLVGRLVTKLVDPDAEVGPPPTLPDQARSPH